MTKKLFNNILAICLLFSSLYLPAHAEPANKVPAENPSTQVKKSPEANFLDGDTCLKQGKTACAQLALANIPSTSAYAKLLQGSIALNDKQTDKAMLLLLPLQTEENLIPQAKITLHQSLASAFEHLDDTQQAIQHLIQAEAVITASNPKEAQASIAVIHEKIWTLLSKLGQTELIELRGNNTDNTFQGWIDLRLAAKNQDLSNSIAGWSALYPDHTAQEFAKSFSSTSTAQPVSQASLSSKGSIALIMPLSVETYSAKADAFKLGLQAALNKHGLLNEVKTYPSSENQQDMNEMYTLAKNEGNAYFIMTNFAPGKASDSEAERIDTNNIVHISTMLDDEARQIVNFALSRQMQKIAIVTTDSEISKHMAARFQAAWKNSADHEQNSNLITIITLPGNISPADGSLIELKSQLAEKMPDMILLALAAADARTVRPYLPISTPTTAFSCANEMLDNVASYQPLNAVRLFDIPYLLNANQLPYKDYEATDDNLNSNELLRWFALGVDSLQLLITSEKLPEREISINGLSGALTVDKSGNIKRQLSLAKFTQSGIELEQ